MNMESNSHYKFKIIKETSKKEKYLTNLYQLIALNFENDGSATTHSFKLGQLGWTLSSAIMWARNGTKKMIIKQIFTFEIQHLLIFHPFALKA